MKKIAPILILILLSGCSTLKGWINPISSYDQKSYENFITLKVITKQFVNECSPIIEQQAVDNYFLALDLVYEYEVGKSDENIEIIKQIELFRERAEAFYQEAIIKELSQTYKDLKKETLTRILDVIIATEYQKQRR